MFDGILFYQYKTQNVINQFNTHGIDMIEDVQKTIKVNDYSFSGCIKSFYVPQRQLINKAFNYMYGFHMFEFDAGGYSNMMMSSSYIFVYILSGECLVTYDGKTMRLDSNNGIFISANATFSINSIKGCSFYTLAINGSIFPYIYQEFYSDNDARAQESINGKLHTYINELLNIYSSNQKYRDLRASHMIEEIAIHLLSIKLTHRLLDTDIPSSIQLAMRYMEDNYPQNLSLDKIADYVILDKYHFAKEFKKYVGTSPKQYLIGIRLEQAKFLLKTTDLPASKVALQVGFTDVNNFYNQFKALTGMTPIKYRETN